MRQDEIKCGLRVMCCDPGDKLSAFGPWKGPYTVERLTKGGMVILKEYDRPVKPTHCKLADEV